MFSNLHCLGDPRNIHSDIAGFVPSWFTWPKTREYPQLSRTVLPIGECLALICAQFHLVAEEICAVTPTNLDLFFEPLIGLSFPRRRNLLSLNLLLGLAQA